MEKKGAGKIRKIIVAGAVIIALILLSFIANAFPPIAAEYYGDAIINGKPAPVGTRITVYDTAGNRCGDFETNAEGKYGFLSCKGDDSSTAADEGALKLEDVVFHIDGRIAAKSGSAAWSEGSFKEINLSYSERSGAGEKDAAEEEGSVEQPSPANGRLARLMGIIQAIIILATIFAP